MSRSKIVLVIFLAFFFAGGIFVWQGIFWPGQPLNQEWAPFEVKKGEGVFFISENLEKKGFIKDKIFFQLYVVLKKKYRNLGAGTYFLSPSMSTAEIAQTMFGGGSISVKITIPEGFTLNQIEEKLTKEFSKQGAWFQLKDKSLESYIKEFDFLKEIPEDAIPEGFMFPDTYFFDLNATEQEITKTFLENFDKKLAPDLREEIKKQQKTFFDIVIMASLLEKEVKTLEEKKLAAGILWKRLRTGIPLQVDATITYITDKKTTKISVEETKIDSPYNTYKYLGLPKGPICNPGLESIEAAIFSKESEFWYYLSVPAAEGEPRPNGRGGETIFSKTIEEHNIAKAKYLE